MRWLLPALLLLARPAQAHIIGARLGDFYAGMAHPLTTPADVVLWVAMGLLSALQPARWARWIVLVFPAGLLAGFAAASLMGWQADPLLLDAALMVALGGSTALGLRLPGPVLLLVAAALAASRGAANASGAEAGTDTALFAGGLVAAGYVTITLVAGLVRLRGPGWQVIAVRAGGSWIAAIGVMVGGYALKG